MSMQELAGKQACKWNALREQSRGSCHHSILHVWPISEQCSTDAARQPRWTQCNKHTQDPAHNTLRDLVLCSSALQGGVV